MKTITRHRAERVILISLMKSGTHLLQELMATLGYKLYGHARISSDRQPVLDGDARWRIASMFYDDAEFKRLLSDSEPTFNHAAERAWQALAWSWQLRFGMPLRTWYGTELASTGDVAQALRRTAGSSFAETPASMCWIFHQFDIAKIDGDFLREWTATGEPRIVFNYRDPRDATLSMVNFLCGKSGRGLSAFSNLQVFSRILLSMDTMEERLTYALTDCSFPCNGDDFRRTLWLLHHPDVCKTSFEELVGPDGGGSAASQTSVATRLINFLGVHENAEDIAGRLFNRNAFSFHKGQIGAWREIFTDEHRRLADERFGDVVPLYGYT